MGQVRIVSTIGQIGESLFALKMLEREAGGAVFADWRQQVHARLGDRVASMTRLARHVRPVPDLYLLLVRAARQQKGESHDRPVEGRQVAQLVTEFHQIAIAPYWQHMVKVLEAERDTRSRMVADRGFGRLLATLHPKARWRGLTLEIPNQFDRVVHLDGRGLLLAPSLFLFDRAPVLVDPVEPSGPPTLVYRALVDQLTVASLWSPSESYSLGALIGRTRAAALVALTDSCSTSELGRRLRVSAATASQHAAVLRNAGLIVSHRSSNTVQHTLTPLGTALLIGPDQSRSAQRGLAGTGR